MAIAANRGLELIGRALGVFVDRKEVGGPGEFDHLNDEELEREIAWEAELLGLSPEREVTEPAMSEGKPKPSTRHCSEQVEQLRASAEARGYSQS